MNEGVLYKNPPAKPRSKQLKMMSLGEKTENLRTKVLGLETLVQEKQAEKE